VVVEKEVKGDPVVIEKPVIVEKEILQIQLQENGPKDYYIGSKETKKYHKYDCKWIDGIKLENRDYLKTQKEAKEKGYKKCGSCMK